MCIRDSPYLQSSPNRLDVGSEVHWQWSIESVRHAILGVEGRVTLDVRARCSLATGVTSVSDWDGVEHIPIWKHDISAKMQERRREWLAKYG